VVVPVLYTYFDTWGEKVTVWFKRGTPAAAQASAHLAGGGSIAPLPAARKDE